MYKTRKFNINNVKEVKKAEREKDRLYNEYDTVRIVKVNRTQIIIVCE